MTKAKCNLVSKNWRQKSLVSRQILPVYFLATCLMFGSPSLKAQPAPPGKMNDNALNKLKSDCASLLSLKRKEDADKLVDKAIRNFPKDERLYFQKALIKEEQKDPYAAMKALDKAIECAPNYTEAYLLRAKGNYMLFELTEEKACEAAGRRDLSMVFKLNPKLADAHDYQGVFYAAQNNMPEALKCFNQAISLKPEKPEYYKHRALVYNQLKRPKDALNDLVKVTQLDPREYGIWVTLAEQADSMGLYKQSIDAMNQALVLRPANYDLMQRRAAINLKNHRFQEALVDLDKLIKVSAQDDDLFRMRAQAYIGLKQYKNALNDQNQAAKLNPTSFSNFAERAKTYRLLGDEKKAKQDENRSQSLQK